MDFVIINFEFVIMTSAPLNGVKHKLLVGAVLVVHLSLYVSMSYLSSVTSYECQRCWSHSSHFGRKWQYMTIG